MNKQQMITLTLKFKKLQELNLKLFEKELKDMGNNMDFKEEKLDLELGIYRVTENIKLHDALNVKEVVDGS
jgi:hypothetical protein